jgi:hypothetical protein
MIGKRELGWTGCNSLMSSLRRMEGDPEFLVRDLGQSVGNAPKSCITCIRRRRNFPVSRNHWRLQVYV